MGGMRNRSELADFYRRYNALCNEHDFDRLGEFVAEDVRVDGEPRGLAAYAAGLREVIRAFPDYRWDLRHLLVDGDWIAAHFIDTGTHRGRTVSTQEFAFYRVQAGKIAEVWVTADDLHLQRQLQD